MLNTNTKHIPVYFHYIGNCNLLVLFELVCIIIGMASLEMKCMDTLNVLMIFCINVKIKDTILLTMYGLFTSDASLQGK